METLQWFQWRKKYSHGDSNWEIEYVNKVDSNRLEDYIDENFIDYYEGEKYRGFDFELLDILPPEFIQKQIARCNNNIAYNEQMLTYFNALLATQTHTTLNYNE